MVGLVDVRACRQFRICPLSTLTLKRRANANGVKLLWNRLNMTVVALAPVVTRDASM